MNDQQKLQRYRRVAESTSSRHPILYHNDLQTCYNHCSEYGQESLPLSGCRFARYDKELSVRDHEVKRRQKFVTLIAGILLWTIFADLFGLL